MKTLSSALRIPVSALDNCGSLLTAPDACAVSRDRNA